LVDFLEQEIAQRRRKRVFPPNEQLGLSPGTIKRVVEQLQDWYLFGIDEDLNGRMFEAFLAATMRGQDLGQYFTPRSIVKLITRLANLEASRDRIERVLDACCGTGGFLIEALTDMRRQIYDNTSLTKSERKKLLDEVANQAIFGIDAGRDPPIARIARINMYLHGDGGSRVYMTDGLRPTPEPSGADSLEVRQEVGELRTLLQDGTRFNAVLTNPPFSMDYSANVPEEKEVLVKYDLASYGGKRRSALRSLGGHGPGEMADVVI
jgi:type I restriction enzyme M protein